MMLYSITRKFVSRDGALFALLFSNLIKRLNLLAYYNNQI